jgi:hypothetical protein
VTITKTPVENLLDGRCRYEETVKIGSVSINEANMLAETIRGVGYATVDFKAGAVTFTVTASNGWDLLQVLSDSVVDAFSNVGVNWSPDRDRYTEVDPERWEALRLHLGSRHALGNWKTHTNPVDEHQHEHDGPGTIRNHPRDDLSYDRERAEEIHREAEAM